VERFADELCPYPWRVPTVQNFIDLDIAFGGNGTRRSGDFQTLNNSYMNPNVWGGNCSGSVNRNNAASQSETGVQYWSISAFRDLHISCILGQIDPQGPFGGFAIASGYSLRCIRNAN
jgi:hypothetical protein